MAGLSPRSWQSGHIEGDVLLEPSCQVAVPCHARPISERDYFVLVFTSNGTRTGIVSETNVIRLDGNDRSFLRGWIRATNGMTVSVWFDGSFVSPGPIDFDRDWAEEHMRKLGD